MADQPAAPDAAPARRATDLPPDAPWWARWLVANINEAWKWGSMRWPAFCAAALEVYAQYQDQINAWAKGVIPSAWWPHVLAAAFILSMLLRVVNLKRQPPGGNP